VTIDLPPTALRVRTTLQTATLTAVALFAFAGNSWLCRSALRGRSIDPASFTAVRIASGALVLALLVLLRLRGGGVGRFAGSLASAAALFAYAIAFSFAYLALSAGVGALILFGAVQLTMLAGGFLAGQKPTAVDAVGIALALGGLAWLVLPGATAPEPLDTLGMALAGVAWGVYSLRGRRESAPALVVTAGNFLRAVPLALAVLALAFIFSALHASPQGLLLAALSGALTSGVGYAIWYAALPGLKAVQAGLVQLAVPVLTAVGGVLFLGERWSARLVLSTALVLSGIALALFGARSSVARPPRS
jgi:drug/metabolite transporter (DMT)-like permease